MIEIRQGGKQEQLRQEQTSHKGSEVPKEEKNIQAASCQPKNFRQIGSPSGKLKIYFEDYVYTYLHPVFESPEETRLCILLGKIRKENDIHYIFVSGAMELGGVEFAGVTPIFTERTREEICTLMKHHFDGQYLVGWHLDLKGNTPKLTPEIERIHRNFFGGRNKLLLLSDSLNREEKLFAYENNAIWQKDGYYIYYEKNPQMQEYMITTREAKKTTIQPEKVVDEALKNYRDILMQKEEKAPRRFHAAFYATSIALVFTICAFGVNMLNNYDKMKEMEGAISVLSNSVSTETEEMEFIQDDTTETSVIIESINGEMEQMNQTQKAPYANQNAEILTEKKEVSETTNNGVIEEQAATDAEDTAVITEPLTEAETIRLQGYYIVQKGENLVTISRKIYGDTTKMSDICTKNNIENSDQIYAGQKLLLP